MLAAALLMASARADWFIQNDNFASIVMAVDFVDENTGRFGGSTGSSAAVWLTRDGGATFKQEIRDSTSVPSVVFGLTIDGNSSVAGGLGAYSGLLGPGAGYTIDDGLTWQASPDQLIFIATYQSVEAVDGTAFCTGYWYDGPAANGYGVSVSQDGGVSWDFFDWGIDGPPDYGFPETPRYGSFLSPTVGFVAGGHWPATAQVDVLGRNNSNFALSRFARIPAAEKFAPAHEGVTGYRAVIAKTADGGRSWELLYDAQEDYYFNQISMANETHGCAVAEGERALILCTYDGAVTWEATFVADQVSLVAVDFATDSYVVAGGAEIGARTLTAAFWHSFDAGRTWAPMAVSSGAEDHMIFGIDMVSESVGYATALNINNGAATFKFTV